MGLSKLIPQSMRPFYYHKRGIPFTKGYDAKFDVDYGKKSREWERAQSVVRKNNRIESEIETEKGLAVQTRERELEIVQKMREERYSFEEPCVLLNPYGLAPLCAYILFYTEEECKVRFCVRGKTAEADISDVVRKECKWHRVPVYGLYPGMKNTVILTLLDGQNKTIAERELTIETEQLPEYADDLVRVEKKTAPSAIKLILVAGKSTSYPVAFDECGEIGL